jgi:hypothetical protein
MAAPPAELPHSPLPTAADFADAAWLAAHAGIPDALASAVSPPAPTDGLSSASLQRVLVARAPPAPPLHLVLKLTPPSDFARDYGLAREALFYASALPQHLPALPACALALPRVLLARGDVRSGAKAILMERVEGAQCGAFYGSGSPLNWGKDLGAACAAAPPGATAEAVTAAAFAAAAALHGAFWRAPLLLEHAWLARSEEEWGAAQRRAAAAWAAAVHGSGAGSGVRWNARLVAIVEASLRRAEWRAHAAGDAPARAAAGAHYTLLHGDLHPANMVLRGDGRVALLDWEAVRLGAGGAQELGQYVISHMAPAARRAGERARVEAYHAALARASARAAAEYSAEEAWRDYVWGGAERWVWLLALLAGLCEAPAVQYFHDQLLAFCEDHGVTPEAVGMPRV